MRERWRLAAAKRRQRNAADAVDVLRPLGYRVYRDGDRHKVWHGRRGKPAFLTIDQLLELAKDAPRLAEATQMPDHRSRSPAGARLVSQDE